MDELESLKKEAQKLRDQKDEMIRKIFDFPVDGHSDIIRMNKIKRMIELSLTNEKFIKEFIEDQERWITRLENLNLP